MQCDSIFTFKWNLISKKSNFLSSINNQLVVTGSAQQHRAEVFEKSKLKIVMVKQNGQVILFR
jgi:hypothetical protein